MKVKICGITKEEEIHMLEAAGVDYAGFVLYEKSRRHVTIPQAAKLKGMLPPGIKSVAVTVSPDADMVSSIEAAGFDIIQIHKDLDEEVLEKITIPVWRAINVSDADGIKEYEKKLASLPKNLSQKIEAIVADAPDFGSGVAFDWKEGAKISGKKFVLAGGLNASNVRRGIMIFSPDIVDVSSSVEGKNGKDEDKIMEFVKAMNNKAYYGEYGGQFVSESLMNTLAEVDAAFEEAIKDPEFLRQYDYYLKQYVGRETPLYFAERLSAKYGTKIYLKREDLNHTGAHKINNVIGQILLAKRMGKKKVIAETGAGQHGVATATGAALFDMECTVYMGKEDVKRQALNVMRMEMLGATVVSVESGSNTLKDATNEAIRTWSKTAEDTFYIIGSAIGPYPYPKMVKEFQSVISREAKRQHMEAEGKLPDVVMACVGGGSNSIGMFADFMDDKDVELIGVEAAGKGIDTEEHAASMAKGRPGVLHGTRSYLLQDDNGNIKLAHSISAGLDYPGVGPEHAYLHDTGRAKYVPITDSEAMDALMELTQMEGIIPAIESAHAMAYAFKKAKEMTPDQSMIVCLSGRGDKDVNTISDYLSGKGYLN